MVKTTGFIPKRVIVAGALITAALLAVPFFLKDNQLAQALFGFIVAIVTTLVSVYATHRYSESSSKGELTRYGLQAWRNLDSLGIKVSQQVDVPAIDSKLLEGWLLDIDQAKWAWRDLLREVFELQARLQAETDEVAAKYKAQIASAASPDARSQLESKQALELAKLISRAPLPIRVPVDVSCPWCGTGVTARLGPSPGDTAWPMCPKCELRFPVHRQPDGGVKPGDTERIPVAIKCPACAGEVPLRVPADRTVLFERTCPHCRTHIQFEGSARDYRIADLKEFNAEVRCPSCGKKSRTWVSPGRSVRFLAPCEHCAEMVQIQSDGGQVTAEVRAEVEASTRPS